MIILLELKTEQKHAYLLNISDIGKLVFFDRKEALRVVKESEKNKKKILNEKYYEEY